MAKVLGCYQAQSPSDSGPREAFAVLNDTIMGYCVVRCVNHRQTGQTSYGMSYHESLLLMKAQEEAMGGFSTSIEPFGKDWQLCVYHPGEVSPADESMHASFDEALHAGRQALARLCAEERPAFDASQVW